jgi:ATP-dependent helicase/nuclease subunit A
VLEAGAGTGKTTLLVDRIEALVRAGRARLDEIAAVTFTENAATTMKLRLRERLERVRAEAATPALERERASAALQVLERAQISTIHALCAAVLQERPLESGVLPGFRVADEALVDVLFAEAWDEWLVDRLVGGDDAVLAAMDRGIPLEGLGRYGERESLRGLARTLLEQRDLRPIVAGDEADPRLWREELLARAARAQALVAPVRPGDALAARLTALCAFAEDSRPLSGEALASHLRKLPAIQKNFGFRPHWPSPEALEEGRRIAEWTKQAGTAWNASLNSALHGRLVATLLGVVAIYERRKAERGMLDFLDLLLKARQALERESVRRHFRERFRFVIIDEFQDTDPLQVSIAQLLAGDAPGSLVVVGDAKQSIYRFRRADVAIFRRIAREASSAPGRAVLHLTQNFRSRPAILRFVNRVFGRLIVPSEEIDQPAYEAIDPPPGLSDEPSVVALRLTAPFAEGADLLRAEADALARFFLRAAEGAHEVRDPATGATRASRAGDVMVLCRRLTQLRLLEDALEAADLRFTVEGGKSFFDRQEVHEVHSVIRAIDDPSDRVSLVAALRSSFFGVSDRDIVTYVLSGGSLWLGAVDESRPGAAALGPAVSLLGALHRWRLRLSVPALLEKLYDETRVLAALGGTRRGEAQVANLEKVVSLARQASALGALTLRGFATLLASRIEEASEEPDLPTTRPGDPGTIRVLSIHKAKGLEAPIVAICDTADNFNPRPDVVPFWEEGKIAIGFREECQPPEWDSLSKKEKARIWAEARRLQYVACTRARDLLVIPSPPADARVGDFWKDVLAFLPARSDGDVRVIDAETLPAAGSKAAWRDLRAFATAEGGDPVAERWEKERAALIEAASQRPLLPVPATRVAARLAPAAAAAAPRPEARGFGALVHRILEWIPLAEAGPEGTTAIAEALAPSFGLDADAAARAAATAARALELPVMRRARAASRLWRELPLLFPEGGELVEGVVDLVFEEQGELVIVDYKTDQITPEQALAQAAHHAPQLQLYGRGLAAATGLKVRERLVLFTVLGQAVQV